jgi:hypothetical protein
MPLPPQPVDYAELATQWDTYGSMRLPYDTETEYEEVPLGVFVLTEVMVREGGEGATMEVIGVDRSIRIQKAAWVDPYSIDTGTNLTTALNGLLTSRWPDVSASLQATSQTVPKTTLGLRGGSSDPWKDAQQIASSGGFDLYFDAEGDAVLVAVSDPGEQSPVESYVEGAEAMVTEIQRRISTDDTYNGVVVTGEGSRVKPPVRATLFDEDNTSPTYRYGPFGDRPKFISTSLVTTASAAAVVAAAELSKLKGAEENVEWSQICDPSLDAGDVILVENTGTRLSKVVVIDKLQIPLGADQGMRAVARTVRVLS